MKTMGDRLDAAQEELTQDLVRAIDAWISVGVVGADLIVGSATILQTAKLIRSRAEEKEYAAGRAHLSPTSVVEFESGEVSLEEMARIKKAYGLEEGE